jgi:hypothetical protein
MKKTRRNGKYCLKKTLVFAGHDYSRVDQSRVSHVSGLRQAQGLGEVCRNYPLDSGTRLYIE